METVHTIRKLIDIKAPIMSRLSIKAAARGVSLKKYIENLLEENAADISRDEKLTKITSSKIRNLVGIAQLHNRERSNTEDERLQYILSK